MRQLTHDQAEAIATDVAARVVGFQSATEPFSAKHLLKTAEFAAFSALKEVGCLDEYRQREGRRIELLANAADAKVERFQRAKRRAERSKRTN